MSRSYKKPWHGTCKCKDSSIAKAKKHMTRSSRREINSTEDFPSGNHYRKIVDQWIWRPDDGRTFNPSWPKAHRK